MMKKLIAALVLSLLLAGTSMASPTVFSDNFDSYGYALNWGGGGVWSVTGGTVDLIGDGTPYPHLPPGNGKYVDLDGNGQPGVLATQATFTLMPGITYKLSFDLAGNQGTAPGFSPTDTVTVAFGPAAIAPIVVPSNQLMQTYTVYVPGDGNSYAISFQNSVDGDRQGALLDNVSLTVPAPGAVLLGSLGVGLVGWFRRRRAL